MSAKIFRNEKEKKILNNLQIKQRKAVKYSSFCRTKKDLDFKKCEIEVKTNGFG